MRAVTISSLFSVHAPSVTERPISTPRRHSARLRWTDILWGFVLSWSAVSVDDEAKIALVTSDRFGAAGDAVDPADLGEQRGLGIGRGCEPVVGARQFLLRHRPNHIGRHDDHQLGLVIDEVLAPEELAEKRYLIDAGHSVDGLLGLFLN